MGSSSAAYLSGLLAANASLAVANARLISRLRAAEQELRRENQFLKSRDRSRAKAEAMRKACDGAITGLQKSGQACDSSFECSAGLACMLLALPVAESATIDDVRLTMLPHIPPEPHPRR